MTDQLPVGEKLTEMPMFGFEKNERSKNIKLDLLKQSVRVEDNLGRSYRTRPIQAWSLLTLIAGMLKDHEIGAKAHPITVRSDSSGVALNDVDKTENKWNKSMCPINKWIFDQLITKIDIPKIGNNDVTGTIAVSYTSKGISVAFGLNVSICDNLCIMGGQQMRTYKFHRNEALAWESMKIQLRDWIANIDQRLGVELQIMQRMQEREINNEIAVDQVIGKLYQNAVRWRYGKGPVAPFDISGMSTFVQNVQRKGNTESLDNVWDLYNWGTEIMKPENERLEHLAESHGIYADFLCEEFGIEREDLLQEIQIVD
jgi:hypothetical protein